MSKPTKTKQNYNEEILKTLETKWGYSFDYMRKCLRGDRTGVMPDEIVKEYKRLESISKKAINKAANIQ